MYGPETSVAGHTQDMGNHLPAFAPSSIQQVPGERESGFAFFSRVARRLPCYTLSLGGEPAEIAGKIGEFLERTS